MNELITTADVKAYLRIPHTDDDTFIAAAIQDGYDYLADAIDDYATLYAGNETFARKCNAWVLRYWMPDAYDQREGGYDGQRVDMNRPARAMLTQLQMYKVEEDSDDDDESDD